MIIRVVMNKFTRLSEREQRLELIKNLRLPPGRLTASTASPRFLMESLAAEVQSAIAFL